ncbi:MAG: glycosyltransferase family 9 protein [Phycisphaerales bacterium]|nr:glycosyltransferase family 9 protein [Phycisphaerales bacterium]
MAGTIPPQRILLLRPSALGDVCRTVPVLTSLRQTWPEAEIHWVVQSKFAAAIASHPALTGVIPFPREAFRGSWRRPMQWAAVGSWLRGLRAIKWDLAIDCQGLARTGFMLRASGASVRVVDRAAREGAWLAGTRRVVVPEGVHEVDRMLALAEDAGAALSTDDRLHVAQTDLTWWSDTVGSRGRYAVLASTSRWASKAWPASHWVELGERIIRDGHAEWIALPGSSGEQTVVAPIAAELRQRGIDVIDYSGRTSIGQLMALLNGAAMTVSNDSAALHMAAGLGGRCLGLFGPTDPAIVGPWRRPESAIRATLEPGECPAYRDTSLGDSIMRRLSVSDVYARLVKLLAEWKA